MQEESFLKLFFILTLASNLIFVPRPQATVRSSNGSLVRITLPLISECTLVSDCLRAVVSALPRDTAVHFQARWYATRNAPGPACISPSKEWRHFSHFLLRQLGYDTEILPLRHEDTQTCTGCWVSGQTQQQRFS